jgi:hypothetical protein
MNGQKTRVTSSPVSQAFHDARNLPSPLDWTVRGLRFGCKGRLNFPIDHPGFSSTGPLNYTRRRLPRPRGAPPLGCSSVAIMYLHHRTFDFERLGNIDDSLRPKSCRTFKSKSSNAPIRPKGLSFCRDVGLSNAPLRGLIVAAAWPKTSKISPETHSLFSVSPQFVSRSKSFI